MTNQITEQQKQAVIAIMKVVADAIKELGEVPSGHLYAQLCGYMTLDTYNSMIDAMISAGVVKRTNHLLIWVGK